MQPRSVKPHVRSRETIFDSVYEMSARVLGKSGHSEATAVVALELLGRAKGKMVEDVAKHVQKLHAMQAIVK